MSEKKGYEEMLLNQDALTLAALNTKDPRKDWDHLMLKGHKVADLEQIQDIVTYYGLNGLTNESHEFETWCCMHPDCNYLEFRLKEGHREDR